MKRALVVVVLCASTGVANADDADLESFLGSLAQGAHAACAYAYEVNTGDPSV